MHFTHGTSPHHRQFNLYICAYTGIFNQMLLLVLSIKIRLCMHIITVKSIMKSYEILWISVKSCRLWNPVTFRTILLDFMKFLLYGIRWILYEIHKIHNEICSKSIMKSALSEIYLKCTKFQLKSAGFHEIHGISQDVINSTPFHWNKQDFIMDFTVDFICWVNYEFITDFFLAFTWNLADFTGNLVDFTWNPPEISNNNWFNWDSSLSPCLSYGIKWISYEIHKIHKWNP